MIFQVVAAFCCNFASGPATVMSNKLVFRTGFRYPVLLTVAHYGCTWLLIKVMAWLGFYSPAPLVKPSELRRDVVLLILAWSFYNIASNLSLSENSVGIYQMIKLLMAPGCVAWDMCLYGKKPSIWQSLLLLLAVIGISTCTTSSLDTGDLRIPGLLVALLAVVLAILQKGLTSHVTQHSEVKLSPLQLLESCMPWMAGITIFSALCLEDLPLAARQLDGHLAWPVLLSSACGTMANVSSTWVLGLTSPLAHVLLGQLKTVVILLGGVLFFDREPSGPTVLGAGGALLGITLYAHSKLPRPAEPPMAEAAVLGKLEPEEDEETGSEMRKVLSDHSSEGELELPHTMRER